MAKNAWFSVCACFGYMLPALWGQTYQPYEAFVLVGLFLFMFALFTLVDEVVERLHRGPNS
jgi:hypothetical protein